MANKLNTSIIFLDLIFALLLTMSMMFILAYIHINENVKKHDIIVKDNYLITLEWNKDSSYDFDIHVKNPKGYIINFKAKAHNFGTLEHDDIGKARDTQITVNGEERVLYINREVIHLKNLTTGRYILNLHYYNNMTGEKLPHLLHIEMLGILPYKILYNTKIRGNLLPKEEMTIISFWYDSSTNSIRDIDKTTQYYFVDGNAGAYQ